MTRLIKKLPTKIMGIVNTDPHSFYEGSRCLKLSNAIDTMAAMIENGADILDIGGESTRPGADSVSVEQELERVIPVIEAAASRWGTLISVDTSQPEVMNLAVQSGARIINDVRALTKDNALETVAKLQQEYIDLKVVLMHMQDTPKTMQSKPFYQDVVNDVHEYLSSRINEAKKVGIKENSLILDPGIGFGKKLEHNISLLKNLSRFKQYDNNEYPVMLGVSRKSMLGEITGRSVENRLIPSVIAAVYGASVGVDIIRVHDVAATFDAFKVAHLLFDFDN